LAIWWVTILGSIPTITGWQAECPPYNKRFSTTTLADVGMWNLRDLVVSQRFYQFCQEHKLKVEDWFPVVVDP
jgi:hypothetical protein